MEVFIKVVGERISNSVARVCVKVTSLAVFLVQLHDFSIHPRALVIDQVLQAGPGSAFDGDFECLFIPRAPVLVCPL